MTLTDAAPSETAWHPGRRGWLWLLAAWALPPSLIIGLLLALGDADAVPAWRYLVPHLVYWLAWAGATPLVVELGRRFPLSARHGEAQRPALHTAVHAAASVAFAVVLGGVFAAAHFVAQGSGFPAPARLWKVARTGGGVLVLFTSLVYWLVLLVARAVAGYRRLRAREDLLAQARLAALKAQVRPHFLFNTLNAVAELIDEDPEGAQEMIARLAELLRASLDRDDAPQEVPLGEELALLRLYLEIEQVRFGQRLDVTFDVAAELHDVRVPHLLLQPLAENAVRHGVGRDSTAGSVAVSAVARGATLVLAVVDDGPGPGSSPAAGVGLRTTRARLRELYGPAGRFELRPHAPRGTAAIVELPIHRQGERT